MAGIIGALGLAKDLGPLLGALALVAGGFGAGEAYEHTAPWGLEAQRDAARASVLTAEANAAKAGAAGQAAADKSAFDQWAARLDACQASVKTSRDDQASAITAAEKNTSLQASAAYRLGRASCGAPNAPSPPPGSGPRPAGVRNAPSDDFADAFAGAPARSR